MIVDAMTYGRWSRWALVLWFAMAAPGPARAQKVDLKLATLVPDGSVWDLELEEMAGRAEEVTDGRVSFRIYPGGVAGDEPDVVRKMRIGQLHAATLSVGGLVEIDEFFTVFQIPMFYESYEELFAVVESLEPGARAALGAKGFVLLNWGHAGWVHLFSKERVQRPDDLRKQKLFVWAGDNRMVQWWRKNGFDPVALAATDILTGLQTGMIQAVPTTPLAALSLQWYRSVPYMLDLGVAPLVGATVVSERAWNRLGEADRAALLKLAARTQSSLEAAIPGQDRTAIAEMAKRGLTVVELDRAQRAVWDREAAIFAKSMVEAMVPKAVYDQAVAAREAFRARAGDDSKAGRPRR